MLPRKGIIEGRFSYLKLLKIIGLNASVESGISNVQDFRGGSRLTYITLLRKFKLNA